MSFHDCSGVQNLLDHVSDLYLKEDFSDVSLIISNVTLPAHRNILSQRCPYFKAMFTSGMAESTSKRVELRDVPLNGFKTVLKWIYTGVIDFEDVENALEIVRLSQMYNLQELMNTATKFVKAICHIDNVCLILNSALLLSDPTLERIVELCITFCATEIITHESFGMLSMDGLDYMLKTLPHFVTNTEVVEACVRWMKANPDKSEHFAKFLKKTPLSSISTDKLESIVPSNLFSLNALTDIAREQQQETEKGIVEVNIIQGGFGATVIHGGKSSYFNGDCGGVGLIHTIGDSRGIVIDLGQRFLINALIAEPRDGKRYAYKVSVSLDNIDWTTVVNHSCYTVEHCNARNHMFYIDKQLVRYIRICGTVSSDDAFRISGLGAYYSEDDHFFEHAFRGEL